MLLAGLVPQEADRRCDFVGVDGVNVAGLESLVGGDVSTSRHDTDGDLMCCNRNKNNLTETWKHFLIIQTYEKQRHQEAAGGLKHIITLVSFDRR